MQEELSASFQNISFRSKIGRLFFKLIHYLILLGLFILLAGHESIHQKGNKNIITKRKKNPVMWSVPLCPEYVRPAL